ncbi:conserved hypothetical protein [Catenulispora acidiphila DSM 44928]|uniref:Uncharacterized protein n=1 Tax=Catenulispora acidiphila (strain DSM 44928 / JCM 14897 / NBRC 102108 / NRRL B-24433 / ID139908) TaxID=479433 RepID=C7PXY8_CATAD|nr:hypothetical protein [Catenulispora acidiphila]ACU73448.1 conserved hypothetical protein [Catenulispora acidiphila DSM 44928]
MDISELTPETLATLRSPRPYPAVTMVMPVDPKAPFSEKDRILLRGLCTEAQRQLAEDAEVEREVRLALRDGKLSPEAVAELVDPGVPAGELVVYVSAANPTQVWQVPTDAEVLPRVEFADRYLTRYLAAAEQRSWPYLVLVLDQEMCRLYRGAASRLREVKEHGFPDAPAIPSPEDAVPGPIPRAQPYEAHEEYVKQYLRTVDKNLGRALKAHDGLPLFVIGGDKILAAFLDLTGHHDVVAGTLPLTGMDKDTPSDLAKRVAPAVEAYRAEQVAAAVTELQDARSQNKYAGGPAEVWTATADKRVQRLLVEEGLLIAGRIGGDGRDLATVPYPEPVTLPQPKEDFEPPEPGVDTDIVEQLVENAVESGAQILFVPDGTLADAAGVAAALRY